jgi:hypothetical protein
MHVRSGSTIQTFSRHVTIWLRRHDSNSGSRKWHCLHAPNVMVISLRLVTSPCLSSSGSMKWNFLNIKHNHDSVLLELGSDASTTSDVPAKPWLSASGSMKRYFLHQIAMTLLLEVGNDTSITPVLTITPPWISSGNRKWLSLHTKFRTNCYASAHDSVLLELGTVLAPTLDITVTWSQLYRHINSLQIYAAVRAYSKHYAVW